MLKITVDIFSGRPNPNWIISEGSARELLRKISLNRTVLNEGGILSSALGYRGVIIESLNENLHAEYGLPSTMVIAAGNSLNESKGIEIAVQIAQEAVNAGKRGSAKRVWSDKGASFGSVDAKLMRALVDEIERGLVGQSQYVTRPGADPKTDEPKHVFVCASETLAYNPGFWNDPAHIRRNNCYAYATNRRTDTFPQPGRASGAPYSDFTCSELTRASLSDGLHFQSNCFPDSERPRLLVALVIRPQPAPLGDYHWYRLHTEGFWGHKPGETPARNVDHGGVSVIFNPETCFRGPYTDFCGYFLVPNSIRVT